MAAGVEKHINYVREMHYGESVFPEVHQSMEKGDGEGNDKQQKPPESPDGPQAVKAQQLRLNAAKPDARREFSLLRQHRRYVESGQPAEMLNELVGADRHSRIE
jgi:hypothetical protein